MFSAFYPWAYLFTLIGMALWFYNQEKSQMNKRLLPLFLGSFLVYAVSLAFSSGDISQKLWSLFRDMMILGIAGQAFILFRKSKIAFAALLILAFSVFGYKWKDTMLAGLDPVSNIQISVDENGEILVELTDISQLKKLEHWGEQNNAKIDRAFDMSSNPSTKLDEYYVVDLSGNYNLEAKIEALTKISGISWVEPNEKIQVSPIPSDISNGADSRFANDPNLSKQWGLTKLQGDKLHQLIKTQTKANRTPALLAILDTGIDAQHEDLSGAFVSTDPYSDYDQMGHGTHCAGIAAAISNNQIGITSLDPDGSFIKITSIKVLNGFGGGSQQSIIAGMIKAADAGSDVINMSLGGISNQKRQKAYEEAVKYCSAKGSIVVCAAGNSKTDASNYSPANTPGVITVSAIDENLQLASFSNYVNKVKMGIAAPGTAIYSTLPNDKYKSQNGTSMAAPFVSSLAALLKSIDPSLTTKQVYDLLHDSGLKLESGNKSGRMIQPADCISNFLSKQ